ncbi:glycoside hydrolase [Ophiobolus disseminans]|uniref:lytic cellulose monooxygenase (C4-dehydrogenating) n=1 Tax=Ophiobolus disseminans TaxID=1469910 RepID=A0A6A7AKI2_9PLEO|nr:glycoside hydrolase [Ophiobolus disseminans]
MHAFGALGVALLGIAHTASAHGYLKSVEVNGVSYLAWQVGSDEYVTPEPSRYVRRVKDLGPVPDFTSKDITCGAAGNIPAKLSVPVLPGDKVKLKWDQWGSSHSGPVMNYLADCGGSCSTFKGDTGTPWVKFDQMAYDTTKSPPWGSDFLAKQGAAWTVTVPNLKPGDYIIRHEILGLHVAGTRNGAQFYPMCVQIKVGGSGTKSLPAGVGLPGAYNPDDKDGVLVELWRVNQGQVNYTAPGGPVKII